MLLHKLFQSIHSGLSQKFYHNNRTWGQWEVEFVKKTLPINVPDCYRRKSHVLLKKTLPISSKTYYLEPGSYPSITDNVKAKNIFFRERPNHSENCITDELCRRTQKSEIQFAKEGSGLALFIADMGHSLTNNVDIEVGVKFRDKGPQKLDFPYKNVRAHSLMIYTHPIEYNILSDAKPSLLRRFPSFS